MRFGNSYRLQPLRRQRGVTVAVRSGPFLPCRLASGCEALARCSDEVSRKLMIPSNRDQLTYRHAQLERHHPTAHRGYTDDSISGRQQF